MARRTAMIAHFHPLTVHLPIGMALFGLALNWLARRERNAALRPATGFVWICTAVGAWFSCMSGWMLAQETGYDAAIVSRHQWWGIGMAISATALAWAHWRAFTPALLARWAFAPALVALVAMHYGTVMTHGRAYLFPDGETADAEAAIPGGAADVPAEAAPAPNAAAVLALRQAGAPALPVAAGSNWLSVNAVNAPHFSDKEARLLEKLAPQIVWLKLGGTAVSDSALLSIGRLEYLSRLHLDGTAVTGAHFEALKNLRRLQLLNLSGTKTTPDHIAQLAGLPALKNVYLYGVPMSPEQWSMLQQKFPGVRLDTGGYVVPTLPTDTARLKAEKTY